MLSQVQGDQERVIAYRSKTLSKSELNYCVTDSKLFAIKHFVEHYKHYLLGRHFTVRTDHQALKWLFSKKQNCTLGRTPVSLLMSRCPDPRDCQCLTTDETLQCGPCTKCRKKSMDMQSLLYHKHSCITPPPKAAPVKRVTDKGVSYLFSLLWLLYWLHEHIVSFPIQLYQHIGTRVLTPLCFLTHLPKGICKYFAEIFLCGYRNTRALYQHTGSPLPSVTIGMGLQDSRHQWPELWFRVLAKKKNWKMQICRRC